MSTVESFSKPEVELIQVAGDDVAIARAAWISTGTDEREKDTDRIKGLLSYLMEKRHGTPFEHAWATIRIEADLASFYEHHRHRIQSFNEESGRYSALRPIFYVPADDRPLVNIGTSARPKMAPADPELHAWFVDDLFEGYEYAYKKYETYLEKGIAKEAARWILPVGIKKSMYASTNLRGWLHFLSLRTNEEWSTYQGHPQYEIEQVAKRIEDLLTEQFPLVMELWNKHGRVAP